MSFDVYELDISISVFGSCLLELLLSHGDKGFVFLVFFGQLATVSAYVAEAVFTAATSQSASTPSEIGNTMGGGELEWTTDGSPNFCSGWVALPSASRVIAGDIAVGTSSFIMTKVTGPATISW